MILTLATLASCATKSDFMKHHHAVTEEILEMKAQQASTKKDLIEQVKLDLRKEVKEAILEQGKEELISEMKETVYIESKKELDQYQEVVNKVIADKLAEHEVLITQEITKALIEGPFIPLLEEKIRNGLSDQQNEMFDSKRESFIKDAVERVLNEIVGKEIGIGRNGAEILKK